MGMSIRSKEDPMTPQRTDKHTGSRKVDCSCEVWEKYKKEPAAKLVSSHLL